MIANKERPGDPQVMLKIFYLLSAILSFGNAGWMLASPYSWYEEFPAGIPHTGPFNSHFIRDLGVVYLVAAVMFLWASRNVNRAIVAHLALTAFFVGHASIHVVDIVGGHLPPSHWLVDTPGVFVPAVLMITLAIPPVRKRFM